MSGATIGSVTPLPHAADELPPLWLAKERIGERAVSDDGNMNTPVHLELRGLRKELNALSQSINNLIGDMSSQSAHIEVLKARADQHGATLRGAMDRLATLEQWKRHIDSRHDEERQEQEKHSEWRRELEMRVVKIVGIGMGIWAVVTIAVGVLAFNVS